MLIWKYQVPPPDQDNISTLVVPKGSKPLSVGMQDGTMVVWVMTPDPEDRSGEGPLKLLVVNTGLRFKGYPQTFLGTVTADGGVVWHIFRYEFPQ